MNPIVKFDGEKFNNYDAAKYQTWTKVINFIAGLLGFDQSSLSFDYDSGGKTAIIKKSSIQKYRKRLEELGFQVFQDFSMGVDTDQGAECVVDYIGMINGDQPFIVEFHWSEKDRFAPEIYFSGFYDDNAIPDAQAKYQNQVRLYKYILFSYVENDVFLEYHTDNKDNLIKEATNQFNKDADKIEVYNVHTGQEVRLSRDEVESN